MTDETVAASNKQMDIPCGTLHTISKYEWNYWNWNLPNAEIDANTGDILSNLKMGFMLNLEAQMAHGL